MIQKITLRDQVRAYLQQEMLDRKIKYGERLSLAEIARKIDVSVTPIREALTQLAQVGIVRNIANRGFFVPQLSIKEAREIYPVIASLEIMAMQDCKYTTSQIKKLKKIQTDFSQATNQEQAVKLDLQFHQALIEPYDNSVAERILSDLKVRVFFYELEYMDDLSNHQESVDGHQLIIDSLEKGEVDQAVLFLKENWAVSLDFIKMQYAQNTNKA